MQSLLPVMRRVKPFIVTAWEHRLLMITVTRGAEEGILGGGLPSSIYRQRRLVSNQSCR